MQVKSLQHNASETLVSARITWRTCESSAFKRKDSKQYQHKDSKQYKANNSKQHKDSK